MCSLIERAQVGHLGQGAVPQLSAVCSFIYRLYGMIGSRFWTFCVYLYIDKSVHSCIYIYTKVYTFVIYVHFCTYIDIYITCTYTNIDIYVHVYI